MINKGQNMNDNDKEILKKGAGKIKLQNVLGMILRADGIEDVLDPALLEAIRWHRIYQIRYDGTVKPRGNYTNKRKY